MSDFLSGYEGQALHEILELEARYRVDSLVLALEQALQEKSAREGPGSLSEPERFLLAVEALEREVNNGGYHQFFSNSSNEYAAIVVAALDAVGCPANAKLARDAVGKLGAGDHPDVDAIEEALDEGGDELVEAMSELDAAFSDLEEDLAGRLFEFVKAQATKFRLA